MHLSVPTNPSCAGNPAVQGSTSELSPDQQAPPPHASSLGSALPESTPAITPSAPAIITSAPVPDPLLRAGIYSSAPPDSLHGAGPPPDSTCIPGIDGDVAQPAAVAESSAAQPSTIAAQDQATSTLDQAPSTQDAGAPSALAPQGDHQEVHPYGTRFKHNIRQPKQ
jgi:hypothetical protein